MDWLDAATTQVTKLEYWAEAYFQKAMQNIKEVECVNGRKFNRHEH